MVDVQSRLTRAQLEHLPEQHQRRDHGRGLEVHPDRAAGSAAYHKADRTYLGVAVPVITDLVQGWRAGLDVPGRVALADALWQTNIHEARVAAAKLLTQARIKHMLETGKPLRN